MKVVILCGGMGTRLREETELKPKPMVEIGDRPILWHIMKTYARYGFHEFVLCLGYRGQVIKNFFLNYESQFSDVTVELGGRVEFHQQSEESGWKVTLAETGLKTMTGARVKRVESYLDGDTFLLTYGDGVTDLDIGRLLEFHRGHGKIGTVTGVCPPSRYGELFIEDDHVLAFQEKPDTLKPTISGGYFVFQRKFLEYLSADEGCVLEREPLERLASEGELKVFSHTGFWQCMDTFRDLSFLAQLWESGQAPWKSWR